MSLSVTIPASYKVMFKQGLTLLLQQKGSRIAQFLKQDTGEGEADFMDRIGATEASETTTRYADTKLIQVPHDRRMVVPRETTWATLVDSLDKIREATDPTSSYMKAAMYAIGRKKDDWVIEGFYADAGTGRTGDGIASYSAGQTVAVNDHTYDTGAGNVGLTLSKLQVTNDLYAAAEVDADERRFLCVNQKAVNQLLTDVRVSSVDYNNLKPLTTGKITEHMGYTFVPTERLTKNAAGMRQLISWNEFGLGFMTWQDLDTQMSQRADKNYNFQIWCRFQGNAIRLEEQRVADILCAE